MPFTPRYAIELTTSYPISAPPTTMRTGGIGSVRPQSIRSTGRRPKSFTSDYGPKYVS